LASANEKVEIATFLEMQKIQQENAALKTQIEYFLKEHPRMRKYFEQAR
jgi:AAA15 family ATPase/GTPase